MEQSLDEIRRIVEGVYQLDEWHVGSSVRRPPDVEGRYVLYGNNSLLIAIDKAVPGTITSWSRFGSAELDKTSFSYKWTQCSKFVEFGGYSDGIA